MVLALLVSLRLVEPHVHEKTSTTPYAHLATAFRNFFRSPRLMLLSIAGILSYAIGEASWLFRSTFVASLWPVWAIGIAQMIGNATAAASFYYAGRIIRRFGEYRLLVGGMTISEAVNLFGLLVPTVLSPALMAANSCFYGVNTVAKNSLIQHEFTVEQRATMGSLNSLAGSITFSLFSFLLGALADRVGVIPALITTALIAIIPMVIYWYVLRPSTSEHEALPA